MSAKTRNPFSLESLEPRQFLSTSQTVGEVEGNSGSSSATVVNIRSTDVTKVDGRIASSSDRDYFRISPGINSRLKISIRNLDRASVKLRLTDGALSQLALTRKSTTVFVDANKTYFIKVQPNSTLAARYQLEIKTITTEVPKARLDKLRKGVNLPEWFWNISGDARSAMRNYVDANDVNLIKQLGFQHVRLPVDIKYFFDPANPLALKTSYLQELHNAIAMFESRGIAVIVCPFGDHQYRLVESDQDRREMVAFSWAFAKFLSRYDPELTFLQTTNEPGGGGWAWQKVQAELITAMRSAAPNNTIITATPLYHGAAGTTFGTVGALNELSPYRDTNIVYGLHFYEPFVFTHQGAGWAIPGMEYLGNLAYPANFNQTERVSQELRTQFTGTRFAPVIDLVRYYGIDGWNRDKVAARFGGAVAWGSRNKVPMILDEFGVYGKRVDDASRYKYMKDVRTIAEAAGFGWTTWDYGSEFGVVSNKDTSRETVRYDIIAALDLRTPTSIGS